MIIDKMAIYLIGNPKGQKEYIEYLKEKQKELDDKIKLLKEKLNNQTNTYDLFEHEGARVRSCSCR